MQKGLASLISIIIVFSIIAVLIVISFNFYKERLERASDSLKDSGVGDESSNIFDLKKDIESGLHDTQKFHNDQLEDALDEIE